MYKPEHVGSVTDTEGREIAFSVDHGTVRLDLLGAVVFLEHEPAVHAVVMLRETRELARTRREEEAGG